MTQIIAFTNDANKVSILSPALDSGLTLEQIATKDIPPLITYQEGEYDENDEAEILKIESPRPYIVMEASQLPDPALHDSWRIRDGLLIVDSTIPITKPVREIDARRLKLALHRMGVLENVKAGIASIGEEAQIEFDNAATIKEDHPLVKALSTNLGLDIDAIFELAASLE